ncbi:MAG: DUF456 domain-containing protein [Planctomycetes bacterium]|nr:DUF456 domain-containing protein [Planctomycetota bacterium]
MNSPTQLAALVQAAGTIGEIAVLTALCMLGVALTVIRLPGTWLIVATAAGYGWYGDWHAISLLTVGVLIGIAVVGEAGEFVASMLTAKKAGAGKRAMWGAFIGGFAGMFIFTIPLPLIGTIIGAVFGCFLGALIGELTAHDDVRKGIRVGKAAAIGYVLGMAFKIAIAFLMAGLLLGSAVVTAIDSPKDAVPNTTQVSVD